MHATGTDQPHIFRHQQTIGRLFNAQSVALIGASADPTKLGSSPINAMGLMGFKGRIHVVNPRYQELLGHPCYPGIDALPDGIEVAMIMLPAPAATDAAEACVARGIKALVMIPQGFGEAGDEGKKLDARLLALAAQGVAITGPNTNGLANIASGLALSLAPILQYKDRIAPGRIAMVSQSGAMISALLTHLANCNLGVGKVVASGNELALNVADYIGYLADDPDTDAIVLYLETIRDMPAFRAAVAKARAAGKPVIATKVGESESGQQATLSHTGAIAGSYRNIVTFLENEGVYVADDLETMAHIAECLTRYDWRADDLPAKPFITSLSGGLAAQMADAASRLGISLENPSADAADRLRALPVQSHPINPYDIAAQNPIIPDVIRIFREDGFNQLLFGLVLLKPEIGTLVTDLLLQAKQAGMDRMFMLSPHVDPDARRQFNAAGVMVTSNVNALLKALKAIDGQRHQKALRGRAAAAPAATAPRLDLPATHGLIDEARSKDIVGRFGIRAPKALVRAVDDGPGDLSALARPVVMKGLSDKIAHKTEHGLVALALQSDADIHAAWDRISAALGKADPDATEILIEEMIGGGIEAILGLQRDPTVGPVVVVGAGGILVELLADAVVLIPPFSAHEAKDALSRTKFGRLLSGYRGRSFDLDALAEAAAHLGQVALANPTLAAIDINPVLVQPEGQGLLALDAKIFVEHG